MITPNRLPFLASILLACSAPVGGDLGPEERGPLDWTLGRWIGERIDPADGSEAPMTMRVEPILGGVGQLRRLEIRTDGGVYRGCQIQVLREEGGGWIRQYVNDVRRTFARLESEGPAGVVWRSRTPGRTRESRLISERTGFGTWRRTMSVSEEVRGSWRVLWIDELRRVEGPERPADGAGAPGRSSRVSAP